MGRTPLSSTMMLPPEIHCLEVLEGEGKLRSLILRSILLLRLVITFEVCCWNGYQTILRHCLYTHMLRCYAVTLLRCYAVTLLRCYAVTCSAPVVLLQCYAVMCI